MIGETLAHFRITAKLGQGGMGEVYRAEDTNLGRDVAIKVLPKEMADDPEQLARFRREARVLAALDHPNVVAVHSVEEVDGIHFLAMGLVDGEPLNASICDEDCLSTERILELAIPLTDALAAAHEKGIVHRDLKPNNVMVDTSGRVKVLDFGLAKALDPPSSADDEETKVRPPTGTPPDMYPTLTAELTERGTVMGTVPYMSPEQIESKPVDHRSDIFSLGVMLYELATGERPFQGDSSPGLMSSILKDEPMPLSERRSDLAPRLGTIIARCLEKDPDDRYQSTRELQADLDRLRLGLTSSTATSLAPRRPGAPSWRTLAAAVLIVAAAVAVASYLLRPAPAEQIDSLAVLPFENGSADPEAEYFSDGVTETIISSLSQLPGMRVISRTSAFRYKGREIDPKAVGEELGVDALVLGRVVKHADDLLVSAELVRAADSGQIWGEQYQRRTADVFAIQGEIARQISEALRIELTEAESERLVRQHTVVPAAYEAYLRGRYHWNRRTPDSFARAIDYFEEAIRHDPDYALPYSGLADTYNLLGYYVLSPDEALPKARAAAERALELEETVAEAHTSLAWVKMTYERDFDAARREYARATELNPSYATTYQWEAVLSMLEEGSDAAGEKIRKALEVDPLSLIIASEYGFWLGVAGRYEESEHQFERALDLGHDFPHAFIRRAVVRVHAGRFEDAAADAERAIRDLGGGVYGHGVLAWAYGKAGRRDDARAVLARLDRFAETTYVNPMNYAWVHVGLGDYDRAFEHLDRVADDRHADAVLARAIFRTDPRVVDDLRFAAFERKLGVR